MLRVWKRQTKLPGELSTRSWTALVPPLDVLPCGLSWNLTFLSRSLTTIACGFGLAYHMPAAPRPKRVVWRGGTGGQPQMLIPEGRPPGFCRPTDRVIHPLSSRSEEHTP